MKALQKSLGYLGLVPFVGLSLLVVFEVEPVAVFYQALKVYAFGIISFLLGSWWRSSEVSGLQLILSNGLFVILFFYFLLGDKYFFPFAAAMLYTIYLIEHHSKVFTAFDSSYRYLRCVLTNVAALSLVLAFIGYYA